MGKTTHNIRIHPPGTKVTDKQKVESLLNNNLKAFGIAKKILVTTEKYRKGGGWFSNKKRRGQKLQKQIYKLEEALRGSPRPGMVDIELKSRNMKMDIETPVGTIIDYFSEVSDAYPNWQPEFKILNKFIPNCY